MDADDVGVPQQVFQGFALTGIVLFEAAVGDIRIVGDDLHAEGLHARGQKPANAAQADDAQGLAVQFHALQPVAVPGAAFNHLVGPDRVAARCQEQADGMLAGGNDIRLRRVDDDDAALRRPFHLDVVHAVPGAADDLQVRRVFVEFLVDFRDGADDDGIVGRNFPQQLFPRPVQLYIHLKIGLCPQHIHAFVRNPFCYQYFVHSLSSSLSACRGVRPRTPRTLWYTAPSRGAGGTREKQKKAPVLSRTRAPIPYGTDVLPMQPPRGATLIHCQSLGSLISGISAGPRSSCYP